MSFDLGSVTGKGDLVAPPSAPAGPNPAERYQRQKDRLQTRLERRLQNTGNLPLTVRIGFLEAGDKTALCTGLEGMGYTCVDENGRLTIS